MVMSPLTMPKLSLRTLATGARQFVVQDALETNLSSAVSASVLTPRTIVFAGPLLTGAEITTFFAPALMWLS